MFFVIFLQEIMGHYTLMELGQDYKGYLAAKTRMLPPFYELLNSIEAEFFLMNVEYPASVV